MFDQKPNPRQQLLQMIHSYWISQSIHVAAKLGIADLVKDGPKTADQLATATNSHAPSLYRLLRALASVEIFTEDDQQRFRLTPMAECLLDQPGSQRAVALMMGDEHFRTWGDLYYSIQTGKPAFNQIYGKGVFEYLSEHAEAAVGLAKDAGEGAVLLDGADGVPLADFESALADQFFDRVLEGVVVGRRHFELASERLGFNGMIIGMRNCGNDAGW